MAGSGAGDGGVNKPVAPTSSWLDDSAWRAVEAVLPEDGWIVMSGGRTGYVVEAYRYGSGVLAGVPVQLATAFSESPTDALRLLVARLTEKP
jgi:hypothetical protein